jgi:ubiquitin-like protein Pup
VASQIRKQRGTSVSTAEAQETSTAEPQDLERLSEIDALLDEIDSVLEENAADFVSQYVQKGGQ